MIGMIVAHKFKLIHFLFTAGFENNADGSTSKRIFRADLVFEEAHVGKMSQFGIIAIDHEGRRIGAHLRAIIQLY